MFEATTQGFWAKLTGKSLVPLRRGVLTMSSDNEAKSNSPCLQNFKLYETRSNFYMVGWEKSRSIWRILKIDRREPSELNILEDSTTYSEVECTDLLRRVHEGNKSTGGLKFVTMCYGIIGFIKFLGPYYMLLITKRRKIGTICGHAIYAITKREMIPIPNSTIRANIGYSKNENRSFVNSACKCEMYLVLLRRLMLSKFGNTYIHLYRRILSSSVVVLSV